MTLRVAVLAQGGCGVAEDLTAALAERGHLPVLVERRGPRAAERLLRMRGFPEALAGAPLALAALLAGGHDVAHALTPADAAAARAWRRLTGRPVVFTPAAPLGRETLSDRRLQLALLTAAVEESDAVTAPSAESQAALWRWMGAEAPVVEPRDGEAHERLYRALA